VDSGQWIADSDLAVDYQRFTDLSVLKLPVSVIIESDNLQVGEHPTDSRYISFVNDDCFGQFAAFIGTFVFEQVALECLAADDFTSAASAKPLCGCFATFKFRHCNKYV
jgi:hypothetical protein